MTEAASKRGVVLTSRSRPLEASDLATFDYLVGMDDSNLQVSSPRPLDGLSNASTSFASSCAWVADCRQQLSGPSSGGCGSRRGCGSLACSTC